MNDCLICDLISFNVAVRFSILTCFKSDTILINNYVYPDVR